MEAYFAPTQTIQVNKVSSLCEICSGPYDTQYCMKNLEQAFVDYASSRTNEMGGKRFTLDYGPRSFNDAANTWKEKPNFNWAHTQTFTNPQGRLVSIHSSSYQIKLEKALLDFDSHQGERLTHLKTQLEQQQDDMIGKINLLWKTISEKLNDASSSENAGNSMVPKSITAISHDEREELRKKGIKSPSKFLSPKYLSPASIKELNKNSSSPKRVHFINSIVILSTDNDTEEEYVSSTNTCDLNLDGMVKGKKGVKEQGKEENEMETDMEVDEVIEKEESEFETNEEVKEILEEEEDDEDGENFNLFPTMEDFLDCNLPEEWEIARDVELNPFKDTLVFRRMVEFLGAIPINLKSSMWESESLIENPINWDKPPKNRDGAWHAKIRLIDPDGEEFTKTLQSIPTTRKLSER
ncbi:hypothetical protein Tco_0648305 [Tanacetum coccineum]